MNSMVASLPVRAITVLFVAFFIAASIPLAVTQPVTLPKWLPYFLGFGSFFGFIHSFHSLFTGWMRLAEKMNKVSTAILFGACYLLVLPLFVPITWLLDPLKMRNSSSKTTFWQPRPTKKLTLDSLRRMS